MPLVEQIKTQMIAAMKGKRDVEKNILRLVMGEVQTLESRQNKSLTDENVYSIIRKLVQKNEETLELVQDDRKDKLLAENEVLNTLLPKTLSQEEIEAWFLNHNDPLFEMIRDARAEGQAIGIAMKALKADSQDVLGDDVKAVVVKIRNS